MRVLSTAAPVVLLSLVLVVLAATALILGGPNLSSPSSVSAVSHITVPFTDDVEVATADFWTADSPWARTNNDFNSPVNSWTDSPAAYYGNSVDVSLTLASPIDLSATASPQLKFWHHYRFERGFDFGYVEVSSSDGASWTIIATYSGSAVDPLAAEAQAASSKSEESGSPEPGSPLEAASVEPWVLEQLSLAAYGGEASVLVRFRVNTDESVVEDGWYLDDIAIDDQPAAVVLDPVSGATNTSLDLSWSTSDAADFASYQVFRSESPGVTFNDTLVATLTGPNSGSYTDAGLPGKTTFHYMVFVVDNTDIYSGSNEVSGITLPGIDYPFSDDMEASGNNWSPEPVNGWTGSHPPRPTAAQRPGPTAPARTMQTMSIPHWSWPTPSPSPPAPSLSSGTCWTSWPATWLAWRYPPTTGPPGERWPPTPA